MCELDASLGPMVSSIKMSYSGLAYTFNEKRAILDRVTDVHLVRPDGSIEQIQDDKLYRVACNMYAANMLGMLNGLTKGILKIEPKYADGTPVEDFYTCSLVDEGGNEVKEWVAFRDYLMSFEPGDDGVPVIPSAYQGTQYRKVKVHIGGLSVLKDAGLSTIVLNIVGLVAMVLVAIICLFVFFRVERGIEKARQGREQAEGERTARADDAVGVRGEEVAAPQRRWRW